MAKTSKAVKKFSEFSIDDAKKAISSKMTTAITESKYYFEGDHWQDGKAWTGPSPSETSSMYGTVMNQIKKQFTSKNAVLEVVGRHVDAVLARVESGWYFVSKKVSATGTAPGIRVQEDNVTKVADGKPPVKSEDPNKELIDEATDALNQWWEERQVSSHIRSAVEKLKYAGRGGIRIFIPSGKVVGNGESTTIPECKSITDALQYIYVESPNVDAATEVLDRSTMEKMYVYVYKDKGIDGTDYEYYESCYYDPITKLTVIKFQTKDPNVDSTEIAIDFDKRSIFFEMVMNPLVTDQVKQNQNMLNVSLTMMARNVIIGGFLERVILSADMPGDWVEDATQPGGKRYVPKTVDVGPGKIPVLYPIEYTDEEGRKTITRPDIRYRDPVSVDTFSQTKQQYYNCILEDCEQTHMIIAGDAFASGEARIQARANFAVSVLRTKPQVDNLVAWLLSTVLEMADYFSSKSKNFRKIKPVVDIRPDTGPLTPDEKRIAIEMYKSGLMSREAAMVLLGSENPDEEIDKIENEKRITTPAELAQILTALSKTGWELALDQLPEVDVNIIGLSPRDIKKYVKQLEDKAKRDAESKVGGSPNGSTNKPGSQAPGPSGGGDGE